MKANTTVAIAGLCATLSTLAVAGWAQSSMAAAPPADGSQKIMQLQAGWRADMSARDYKAARQAHRAAERIREAMASSTTGPIYAHRTNMSATPMNAAAGSEGAVLQKQKQNQQIIQQRSQSVNPAGAGPVGDQAHG